MTLNGSPVESYTYDANGNRISRQLNAGVAEELTYDQQDRLQQQGTITYQYDADGFMTQRGSNTFRYSATGELLNTDLADGQQAAYGYDGLGRRISRTDETGTYQYLYGDPVNPFRITSSKDPAGNLTTYYYDPAGILLALERDGNRYYVAADQIGTPKAVSDQNGEIIKVLEYDSFGKIISDSNPDFYLPISFAGGLGDQATGLVRFGLRDYSPDTGRWAARDPLLFQGGQGNLYVYCGNSPIELRDPSGLKASSPCQSDIASQEPGYLNFNFTGGYIGGSTLGFMLDMDSNWHFYLGGGLVSPGASISVTGSAQNTVSHGSNRAFAVDSGIAANAGYSYRDKTHFEEIGGGFPVGGSAVWYYVW